jgi:hypothetical protein
VRSDVVHKCGVRGTCKLLRLQRVLASFIEIALTPRAASECYGGFSILPR